MSLPAFLVALVLARGNGAGGGRQTDCAPRLPDDTVPESYALQVAVAPDMASFAGRVDIAIRARTAAAAIALNSKGLVVRGIDVTDAVTGRRVGVKSWTYAEPQERVDVSLDGRVLAGRRYTVAVRFEGRLRDDGNGFFASGYASVTGDRKRFAVAQFQTAPARSVFPCYDEPAFRTPFNISLKINSNYIALSNTPVTNTVHVSEEDGAPDHRNRTWVHFARTPPMSTSSVAFFVGEFERVGRDDRRGPVDVYSHLGSLYQAEYADGAASDLLETMANYTAVEYGLPKLNLLAVPELGPDAAGTWGLNTYREKSISVDGRTNARTIMSAKMTTGRAIARQWFGNLVTAVCRDFAWLDDGFAAYFEYFATATLEPDWRLEQFFVVAVQRPALEYDQTPGRCPLSRPPEHTDRVPDRITYGKGAAVLTMLRSWTGEETFRRAVNVYLTRNRHGAVRPEHLWNAFENALFESKRSGFDGENVRAVMGPWTVQAGYPVVNVTRKGDALVLTQQRFTVGRSSDGDDPKWFVRVSYVTSADRDLDAETTTPSVWLDPKADETAVPVAGDVRWYIFNVRSAGFYRVNYAEDNWSALIRQLNDSPTAVHVLNRCQLIDDSFNLARAGQLNPTVPLRLTGYLQHEDDVVPWYSAINGLDYVLDRMRRNENGYADVKAFVGRLAGIAFRKADKLVADRKDLRYPVRAGWNAFSRWACKLDDGRCVKTALNYYRRWRNGEEIPADIQDAAFCTGVRRGAGAADWDAVLALYRSTRTRSEKDSALRALACTANVLLLTAHLNLIPENRFPIDKQDHDAFFEALSSTPSGIDALTSFLRRHSADVVGNVKDGEKMIMDMYSILASKVSTEDEVTKMWEMTRSTAIPVDTRTGLASTYRREIEYNVKWFDDNSMAIREFVRPGSTAAVPETTVATPATRSAAAGNGRSFQRLGAFFVVVFLFCFVF